MKTKPYRKKKSPNRAPRADIYQQITEAIVSRLEQGVAPWRSPYLAQSGFPKNFSSGNQYRGINVFLLAMLGYESPYFLTYKQAQDCGGQVRKGEKGSMIVKAGTFEPKDTGAAPVVSGSDEEDKRWYLKRYVVFNASQIDGVEFPETQPRERDHAQAIGTAQALADAMPSPPTITEGAHVFASYCVTRDLIQMPRRTLIETDSEYYSTLFHEMVHATGHSSRLNRETLEKGGAIHSEGEAKTTYSREELTAEMGASFLCGLAGIETETLDNSAAYIQNWLTVLKSKDNSRWLVSAAAAAQRAADHIAGS